jgi:hypothetical protein
MISVCVWGVSCGVCVVCVVCVGEYVEELSETCGLLLSFG